MKTHQNPLFREDFTPHADTKAIQSPTVFVDTRKQNPKREIRDLRRAESAAVALADFSALWLDQCWAIPAYSKE